MLYIVSQNGFKIAELKSLSIITPEGDLYEDEVYKVFVNGIEFARYSDFTQVKRLIEAVKQFIQLGRMYSYFELPKETAGDSE